MLRTHRLFLFILIWTSDLIDTSTVDPTINTPVSIPSLSSTNSTSDSTARTINANSTDIVGNVTSSSTSAPLNATSSSVSTSGNTTTSPALVTTAANTTSPLVPTTGNATNHPVTDPGNSTTTTLPDQGNSTTLPQTTRDNDTTPSISTPGNSTALPITTPSNVTITAQTTSATCPVPCPPLSVCESSICQCLAGTILLNNVCVQTKSFPSSLRVNRTFENEMNDPHSPQFQKFANEIITAINETLRNHLQNYINSRVLRLTPGSVVASVNMYFELNSPVTQERVSSVIEEAIENATNCGTTNCILSKAEYTESNLCEQAPVPCNVNSTVCQAKDGLAECNCKPGYIRNLYEARSCVACVSGYKAEKDVCVRCPFGYSGFNCEDSSLLALVVVACVLGGLLLIVILAVLVYICVTHRRKSIDSHDGSPYPTEEIGATWPSQNIGHIPRVTLSSSSSNDAFGNNLEMVEGPGKKGHSNGLMGSYDLRTDGMRTFKDPKPTRYSYLMGHENPYFLQGDEKR